MIDTCAIVPVKAFDRAKSRLESVLTEPQRATIARLMAIDVLRALCAVTEIDRVWIMGQGDEQAELASEYGCDYLADDPGLDVSGNVTRATRLLPMAAAKTLLVLSADLPLLTAEDIRALLGKDERGIIICRALRDGGTNALLASPPGRMTFSFGSNSAERHVLAARSAGERVQVIDNRAFQRDIDVPGDLAWLSRYGKSGETVEYLRNSRLAAALVQLLPESMAS
ncbi:MAG TPA: 2-phospho-L-lactate guanylyltransferase [Woeseiaceae bacterium]